MDKDIKDNKTDKTWPSYSQYLGYCSELNITSMLSLDEWIELGNNCELEDKHHHGLGFAPPVPLMPSRPSPQLPRTSPLLNPSGGFDFGAGVTGMLGPNNIISKLFDIYDNLSDPTKSNSEKVRIAVETVLNEVAKNAGSKGGNIKVPKDAIREASLKSSPTSFSVKMPAVESSYSPEIPNTLYSDFYRTAGDRDANLYVTSLNWNMPANEPQVTDYVERILIPDLQTRANISVNFNVNAEQVFTFGKVSSYMREVMLAMQTYYSYANIIAYCGKNGNSNTGMYALRDMISAEDINRLTLLGERLNNIPIPPRLRELSYWMSNIYKSQSECPNSPIMLIVPFSFAGAQPPGYDDNGNGYYSGIIPTIDTIIDRLNPGIDNPLGVDFFNNRFINMLAKVCPGWLGTPMGSADGVPLHDPHWMDVWSNSPCKLVSADTAALVKSYYVPFLENGTDRGAELKYITHSETISGINQALFSTWQYNTAAGTGWSGMLVPKTSISKKAIGGAVIYYGVTNRFLFGSTTTPNGTYELLYAYSGSNSQNEGVFNYANSQSGWYNTPSEDVITGTTSIGDNATFMPVDCQPANGMNLSSNANPSYQSTRWLMSFDEALSGPGSVKGRPPRKRSRGKKDKLTTEE
uniref:Capsid protein n=1 Tax=viral metagenome TaxID=1070528 RepID=A0A2V0RAR8_9ZZZZ